MALEDCDICAQIESGCIYVTESMFWPIAATLLCRIAANTGGGVGPSLIAPQSAKSHELDQIAWNPLLTVPFSEITLDYTQVPESDNEKRYVQVVNNTDAIIALSVDGIVDHILLLPKQGSTLSLGTTGVYQVGPLFVKHIEGAPTKGAVYISSYA